MQGTRIYNQILNEILTILSMSCLVWVCKVTVHGLEERNCISERNRALLASTTRSALRSTYPPNKWFFLRE